MTCRDSSLLISSQLDGRLDARQQWQLEAHLSECPACHSQAAELRCLSENLQSLLPQAPSTEMAAEIIAALRQEARLQNRAAGERAERIDVWRMRIFSQSIGTVVSLVMFMFLVTVILKPLYGTTMLSSVIGEAAGYTDNSEEMRKLRRVLIPPQPNNPRPIFDPSGALLGFSKSFSDDDEFIVMVKVDKDGRASLNKVVEPPRNPEVLTGLSNALFQEVSFQPAGRRGRFVKSSAVLMFSKVNIPG